MSAPPAPALDPVAEQTGVAPRTGTDRAPGAGRARRAPRIRRLVVLVVVVVLVAVAVLTLVGLAGRQGADDPGSPQRTGSAAIAQLLRDQGVQVVRSTDVDDAVDAVRAVPAAADGRRAVTVLVVQPDRLSTDQVAALTAAAPARTVLLTPGTTALGRFGVGGTSSVADAGPSVSPGCADPDAQRAGAVEVADARRYRVSGGSACYPDADGAVLVSLSRAGGRTDLLGLPFRNRTLAAQGNAALGTALLGSQPTLVWLMTPPPAAATTGGRPPALLPTWWPAAVLQALVAVGALGVWQGRRFGPILSERLPVLVRSSETVEGHGRLYHRLEARDRAAAALRAGVIARLSSRYAAGSGRADPLLLARRVAERTGRDPAQVAAWLTGPPPADDDALNDLARTLDRLEQEAHQL